MGCWNETCGISNLPIVHGEKVKAVFLMQSDQEHSSRGVYPTSQWIPISSAFTAEYDSYGGIQNVLDTEHEKLFLEEVNLAIASKTLLLKEDPVKIDSVEQFSSRLTAHSPVTYLIGSEKRCVDLMLVIADVWDTLVKRDDLSGFVSMVESRVGHVNSINALSKSGNTELVAELYDTYPSWHNRYNLSEKALRIDADLDRDLKPLIIPLAEVYCIEGILMSLRKAWAPTLSGRGSQHTDWHIHINALSIFKDIAEAKEAKEVEEDAKWAEEYI